jgi:hypothetical protein
MLNGHDDGRRDRRAYPAGPGPIDGPRPRSTIRQRDPATAVARSYQAVIGQPPKAIGAVLPHSSTANDTRHLWKAGTPCLLYGPGGIRGSTDEDDSGVLISDMVKLTQVLALTAVDVCNREHPAASS